MARSSADLLALQGSIKRDPQSYADEFSMQWRHYAATLDLLLLAPSQASPQFGDLVTFIAHVSACYPDETESFASQLMQLLETHAAVMDPTLRTSVVKALILMRNKGALAATDLMPLLFRMFRVPDKALRSLVFRHITADIKAANRRGRNERLNRAVQNFLYSVLADEHEGTAKRGLAVLTEMWRRHVWRDARTVNVIASAVFHTSPRVSLAALKFFLGQDEAEDGVDSDDEDAGSNNNYNKEGSSGRTAPQGPSREDVYKAFHKGTVSSKKRKQKKLKRVISAVKKAARREEGGGQESFAALQLLHDPQGFAERLFARLRSGNDRFESRLAMMTVLSRVIGVHKLLVLNFYPFLQRYISPSQRDVTVVLAALVQACHEVVPPDALAPVLRQLADQFIHDKARPEVMTVGLKTVREICTRAPLIMTPELLQDLVEYRKFRDKEVAANARAVLGLFRELAPGMLAKRDRGRGADATAAPAAYGTSRVVDRVEGAELLQEALAARRIVDGQLLSSDDEEELDGATSSEDIQDDSDFEGFVVGEHADGGDEDEGAHDDDDDDDDRSDASLSSSSSSDDDDVDGDDDDVDDDDDDVDGDDDDVDDARNATHGDEGVSVVDEDGKGSKGAEVEEDNGLTSDGEDDQDDEHEVEETDSNGEDDDGDGDQGDEGVGHASKRARLEPRQGSLAELKKQLATRKEQATADAPDPLEWGRILSQEDFDAIRQLKHKRLVASAMAKHGLKSAGKTARAREAAEDEAEEALTMQEQLGTLHERRVDPLTLLGKRRGRRDKAERMASVLEGREGREFGAKARIKKDKTGGLSNREKAKRKNLPVAAKAAQARRRMESAKQRRGGKNFKGHKRK